MNGEFKLIIAVWEITTACNMCCKHCGSITGEPRTDELTTDEALCLSDDLANMNVERVTLSGGEPFLRKDWHLIAKRLVTNSITTNAISNGWFIDEKLLDTSKDVGLSNIVISVDGCQENHDYVRVPGSFQRIMHALELMKEGDVYSAVSTCLNKRNIEDLPILKEILLDKGVLHWQLQLGEPMGNLLRHPQLILGPHDIGTIIDFAYDVMKEGIIEISLMDNIGYCDLKTTEMSHALWRGCQAGKSVIGIRSNGDITPCLSIRDNGFVEGNIRKLSLKEIWTGKGAFLRNRRLKQDSLRGFCRNCQYSGLCLAGCASLKLTTNHNLFENRYCIYRYEIEKKINEVCKINDGSELLMKGKQFMEEEQFQFARILLERALVLDPGNKEVADLLKIIDKKIRDCMEI